MTAELAELIIRGFNAHYSFNPSVDCLFITKLRGLEFSNSQIAQVIMTMEETCSHCWNAGVTCNCMKDE